MKMPNDPLWWSRRLAAEPDDACVEAGVMHPEAPVPAAISRLTPQSTVSDLTDVLVLIERGGYAPDRKALFREEARNAVGMSAEDFDRFTAALDG